jgi:chromate transporter
MKKPAVSVKHIFLVFLKIGAFALGGVYSMLAFFQRELVTKRKWLSHEAFAESIVIGQLTPGAPIVNTGIFIGYTLKKLKGALATIIGQVLPSFVLVLILAYAYIKYNELALVKAVLKGIGPAVVGLMASVVYTMSGNILKDPISKLFAIIAFICLAIFKINPIGLIVVAGAAGILLYGRKERHGNP